MPIVFKNRFPEIMAELPARVDAAIASGAKVVEERARVRVPDAPPYGEGLVSAIHTERQGMGDYRIVGGDGDAWYGHFLEFGTSHSAPHPFLVPALEESRDEIVALARGALKHL